MKRLAGLQMSKLKCDDYILKSCTLKVFFSIQEFFPKLKEFLKLSVHFSFVLPRDITALNSSATIFVLFNLLILLCESWKTDLKAIQGNAPKIIFL